MSSLSRNQARPLSSLLPVQPLCTENGSPLSMVPLVSVFMSPTPVLYRINNCVGYSNYKFFFLFLFYTMALCLYIGLSSIYDVVRAWVSAKYFMHCFYFCYFQTHHGDRSFDLSWVKFNTVFLFFMCLIFASGVGFLLFFHIYLVLVNKTTLGNRCRLYAMACHQF